MSLKPGDRLGPYEIERFVGAGGFGSVYRALDPRLSRSVAIKVLSDEIAAEADGLGRFREEARAAASLNHPHLCSVHEVEHDKGFACDRRRRYSRPRDRTSTRAKSVGC